MRGRVAWTIAVVMVVGSACGPSERDEAFARVAILETDADWRERAVGEFIDAEDGQPLAVGDEVRTDETGFAEIEYLDGSLTRLDVETSFRIVDIDGEVVTPDIQVELEAGRVWHRVREVTGDAGGFEVETAIGTAAVRGTAFWMACGELECRISVTDGQVAFTLLDGTVLLIDEGEGIAVDQDGERERGPIDPALLEDEGWAGHNLALDDARGRFGPAREACNATLAGQSLNRATTPSRAVVVDAAAEDVPARAVALSEVDSYDIDLRIGPLSLPAADGAVRPPDRGFATTIDVATYAFVGVGLYEVKGSASGAGCDLLAYVRVTGRNPLVTIFGAIGLLLSVLGLVGLFTTWRRARRTSHDPAVGREGKRVLGVLSGVASGLGAALLLQQFAVLPLSTALLAGAPAVGAAVGALIGWPRGQRGSGPEPAPAP